MATCIDYTLYLVTDRAIMSAPSIEQAVREACEGGVTLVQLREKGAPFGEFVEVAGRVKAVCDGFGVPLVVNDAVDVALEVGAAGVHVGQADMPLPQVRRLVGPDMVVGASAGCLSEALAAQEQGADYLGIGAMAATSTKPDATPTSVAELRSILSAVSIPCVAIGGMNERTIPALKGMGLAGFAVVSAIIAAPDIRGAASRLRALVEA